jgi:hypothetical protein
MTYPYISYPQIGQALHRHFHGRQPRVVVATTASGAIPYYAKLTCVDMHGLNDRWVARHGRITSKRAGHHRMATLRYLLERGVHLVIGHPQTRPREAGMRAEAADAAAVRYFAGLFRREEIPEGIAIVEMPFNDASAVSMLYLTPSAVIDEAVASGLLRRFPFDPRA